MHPDVFAALISEFAKPDDAKLRKCFRIIKDEELTIGQKIVLLSARDSRKNTTLMLVARYHAEYLVSCLEGLTPAEKFPLLAAQDKWRQNVLVCVAWVSRENRFRDVNLNRPAYLAACLEDLESVEKWQLLTAKNSDGYDASMCMADCHPQSYAVCLKGLEPEQISLLLAADASYGGGSVFLQVCSYYSKDHYASLLKGLAPAQISPFLAARSWYGDSELMDMAHRHPKKLAPCLKDFGFSPKDIISLLLTVQNRRGDSALMSLTKKSKKAGAVGSILLTALTEEPLTDLSADSLSLLACRAVKHLLREAYKADPSFFEGRVRQMLANAGSAFYKIVTTQRGWLSSRSGETDTYKFFVRMSAVRACGADGKEGVEMAAVARPAATATVLETASTEGASAASAAAAAASSGPG